MLAKPSPPRFEVEIVIIIIIITIFLCVAFLYYSISVNFFVLVRRTVCQDEKYIEKARFCPRADDFQTYWAKWSENLWELMC